MIRTHGMGSTDGSEAARGSCNGNSSNQRLPDWTWTPKLVESLSRRSTFVSLRLCSQHRFELNSGAFWVSIMVQFASVNLQLPAERESVQSKAPP